MKYGIQSIIYFDSEVMNCQCGVLVNKMGSQQLPRQQSIIYYHTIAKSCEQSINQQEIPHGGCRDLLVNTAHRTMHIKVAI